MPPEVHRLLNGGLRDYLSGVANLLVIMATLVTLIAWTVRQEYKIGDLENRVVNIEQYGTRALSEKVTVLSQQLLNLDQREASSSANNSKRISDEVSELNKRIAEQAQRAYALDTELRKVGILDARQQELYRRVEILEGILRSNLGRK